MPVKKYKQPQEVLDYDIQCWRRLSGEDVIVSVTANVTGPDANLIVERAGTMDDGTVAKVWLSGGTNLAEYKVTVLMTTLHGNIIEAEFLVSVKDK